MTIWFWILAACAAVLLVAILVSRWSFGEEADPIVSSAPPTTTSTTGFKWGTFLQGVLGLVIVIGVLAAIGSAEPGSPYPPPLPESLEEVAQKTYSSVLVPGSFYKLPLTWTVPYAAKQVAGKNPPLQPIYVPPSKELHVYFKEEPWIMYPEKNFLFLGTPDQRLSHYDTRWPGKPHGGTLFLGGQFMTGRQCVPHHVIHFNPRFTAVPGPGTVVLPTTLGKKDVIGQWQPSLTPASPTATHWGDMPSRTLNWTCSIHLTDEGGTPVTDRRLDVQLGKLDTGKQITALHTLPWDAHLQPGDPTVMVFDNRNVPPDFDRLLIATDRPLRVYVALVLSP